jgi:hypothetical protein
MIQSICFLTLGRYIQLNVSIWNPLIAWKGYEERKNMSESYMVYRTCTALVKINKRIQHSILNHAAYFNSLKTKSRLLYLKTQFVPRSKHFSSRL